MEFIYGNETYLVDKKLKQLIKGKSVEPVFYDDVYSVEDIILDISTIGLFSLEKLIIVKNGPAFGKEVESKKLVEALKTISEEVSIIFVYNQEKLDRKKSLIKFLIANSKTHQITQLKQSEVVSVIKDIVATKGGAITNGASIKLSIMLPNNLYIILREVEKLLMETKNINSEIVKRSIAEYAKDDAFALTNAIVDKDHHSIVTSYQQKIKNEEKSVTIISSVATTLTFAKLVNSLKLQSKSKGEIASILGVHPFRIQKTLELCNNLTPKELDELIIKIADIEEKIKSGQISPDIGGDVFITTILK